MANDTEGLLGFGDYSQTPPLQVFGLCASPLRREACRHCHEPDFPAHNAVLQEDGTLNRIARPKESGRLKRCAERILWGLVAGIVSLSHPSHTIMKRYHRAMVADDTRIGQQPGVRMPDVQQAYRRLPDHI